MRASVLAVALFFIAGPAFAQKKAEELLWLCRPLFGELGSDPTTVMSVNRCAGYVGGLLDMSAFLEGVMAMKGVAKKTICTPEAGISLEQAVRLYVRWVEKNPKEMHETARAVFLDAMRDAFPCLK